jgi:hypothetical protein
LQGALDAFLTFRLQHAHVARHHSQRHQVHLQGLALSSDGHVAEDKADLLAYTVLVLLEYPNYFGQQLRVFQNRNDMLTSAASDVAEGEAGVPSNTHLRTVNALLKKIQSVELKEVVAAIVRTLAQPSQQSDARIDDLLRSLGFQTFRNEGFEQAGLDYWAVAGGGTVELDG